MSRLVGATPVEAGPHRQPTECGFRLARSTDSAVDVFPLVAQGGRALTRASGPVGVTLDWSPDRAIRTVAALEKWLVATHVVRATRSA